jgi:hypothetical protein
MLGIWRGIFRLGRSEAFQNRLKPGLQYSEPTSI